MRGNLLLLGSSFNVLTDAISLAYKRIVTLFVCGITLGVCGSANADEVRMLLKSTWSTHDVARVNAEFNEVYSSFVEKCGNCGTSEKALREAAAIIVDARNYNYVFCAQRVLKSGVDVESKEYDGAVQQCSAKRVEANVVYDKSIQLYASLDRDVVAKCLLENRNYMDEIDFPMWTELARHVSGELVRVDYDGVVECLRAQ